MINQININIQSFENINQIIEYLSCQMTFDLDHLLVALENTKKNGYDIQKILNIENTNNNSFQNTIKNMYDINSGNSCHINCLRTENTYYTYKFTHILE